MKRWIFTCLIGLLTAQGVSAMGFFDKPKHCVFSALSGTLTHNGEPVKHARLVRTGQLGHAKHEVKDEVITDENGYFEFPDMYQSASEFGGLAAFRVFQEITLYHPSGGTQKIWEGVKRDGLVGQENRGADWYVECELTNDKRMYRVNEGKYFTNCRWEADEDALRPIPEDR